MESVVTLNEQMNEKEYILAVAQIDPLYLGCVHEHQLQST